MAAGITKRHLLRLFHGKQKPYESIAGGCSDRCFTVPVGLDTRKGPFLRGVESMVIKFHGNVRVEVRVNFLALFASKRHNFMCGALKLPRIVRANVRLNIAIPMLFWSLNSNGSKMERPKPNFPIGLSRGRWTSQLNGSCHVGGAPKERRRRRAEKRWAKRVFLESPFLLCLH